MKMKVKCKCGNSITTNRESVDCLKCGTSIDVDLAKRMARALRDMNGLLRDAFRAHKRLSEEAYGMALDVVCHDNGIPLELHEIVQVMYWHRKGGDAIGRPGLNWAYGILNPIGEWGRACRS